MIKLTHKILKRAYEQYPYFINGEFPEAIELLGKEYKFKYVTKFTKTISTYTNVHNGHAIKIFYSHGFLTKASVRKNGKFVNAELTREQILDLMDRQETEEKEAKWSLETLQKTVENGNKIFSDYYGS